MLLTLHIRIRIVATGELKLRVKTSRNRKRAKRVRRHGEHPTLEFEQEDLDSGGILSGNSPPYFISSTRTQQRSFSKRFRRVSSKDSGGSEISELNFNGDEGSLSDKEELRAAEDGGDSGWDTTEDHIGASIISEPAKATPMQRKWLAAMSDGKHPDVAKRFELYVSCFLLRYWRTLILY